MTRVNKMRDQVAQLGDWHQGIDVDQHHVGLGSRAQVPEVVPAKRQSSLSCGHLENVDGTEGAGIRGVKTSQANGTPHVLK
jgi:hypothetical protein